MHSNRLLSCLGIWLISIIGLVQCITEYYCGNNVVISQELIQSVSEIAISELRAGVTWHTSLSGIIYRGNLCGLPNPTYRWFIQQSEDENSEVVMKYFLLVSASCEVQGVISTGWRKKLGEDDTWCTEA
ncbi:CSEP0105 putative effector protein [Blumeria hordei DH14]|uniref:CSEP0105 putative effector protein n=1 Tax=Blumeria graminis f. sp. hordei (strain DH14) TaxID=546991 RepID=N1J904_BLUG1|nr:CSEP0105 putative effector protein [Blumeria hordei DH14]